MCKGCLIEEFEIMNFSKIFIFINLPLKVKVSRSVMSGSLQPHGLQPARLICPWDFPGKNSGMGCHFLSPGDLPDPRIEPRSLAFQADSLPSEPPGKPTISLKNHIEIKHD